ncbi:MAG: hypothetical protein Q8P18_33190 [Pseudomonadota bacterium]|nr:hypothetical protein [Pseudomonadota bacterium]
MANTATKKAATPYRLVYELVGDGTVVGPTITSAIMIADCAAGPLKDLLSASYASQALMRTSFLYGTPAEMRTQVQIAVNDVTAEKNQISIDVDADAVTATRPEINVAMSDTTGQTAILVIEYIHSIIR